MTNVLLSINRSLYVGFGKPGTDLKMDGWMDVGFLKVFYPCNNFELQYTVINLYPVQQK